MKMALRGTAALFSLVVLATACTAVLGVEDVPDVPGVDAGPSTQSDASNNTETGPLTQPDTGAPDTGAPDTGPVVDPMDTAIALYAKAYCTRFRDCERVLFEIKYADAAECETAFATKPKDVLTRPGVTATAKDYEDCATNMNALSCTTFKSEDHKLACVLKGARKDGEKCTTGEQCTSGFCSSSETTCGTCTKAPESGTPCATPNNLCAPGLVCNGTICVVPGKLSATCSSTQPCDGAGDGILQCNGTKCVAPPAAAGETCNTTINCDLGQGFYCNTTDFTCVSVGVSGQGGQCSTSHPAGVQFQLCRRFIPCDMVTGKCPAPAGENEACSTTSSCLEPLYCIAGKCQKLKPSSFCE